MAYVSGDFLVNIQGTMSNNEIWSNTWAFVGAGTAPEKQECVDALHTFYNDVAAILTANWSAEVADGTDLFTGVTAQYAFEAIVGTDVSAELPNQLAVRCSLADGNGVRGGPFITGFGSDSLSPDGGLFKAADKATLATELEELGVLVLAAGASLGIHRPTTETVVIASTGRVGERFDVIRKRANQILEAYTTVTF